jgi:hypothetical protein
LRCRLDATWNSGYVVAHSPLAADSTDNRKQSTRGYGKAFTQGVRFRPKPDERIANPVTAKQTVMYGKLNVLSFVGAFECRSMFPLR